MIFSQSQFYDVVQYAESKGLDAKLFEHEIITHENYNNLFGQPKKRKLDNPYSKFTVKNHKYYFCVYKTQHTSNLTNVLYNSDKIKTIYWIGDENDNKEKYNFTMYIHMSPAMNMLENNYKGRGIQSFFIWEDVYKWVKIWVDNLVDEIHAIESLERINSIPPFFTNSRSYDDFNQSHTGRNGQILKEKIQLLKSSIIEEIELDDNQFNIINQKLDDLSAKVDKLNKFDFRTAFFGILTNIASSVLYDNAPTFWGIVKKIFGSAVLGDGQNDLLI